MNRQITTLTVLRETFWDEHPQFAGQYSKNKRQNDYSCDIRCAFVEFVDILELSGTITNKLAQRATL